MTLASYVDANDHLDGTKLSFADDAAALPYAREADRFVKGALHDIYGGTVVEDWEYDDVTNPTPGLVRFIAGSLMAAYFYSAKYSEDTRGRNDYAQYLEDRANQLIQGLRDGTLELSDAPTVVSGVAFSRANFYPNANAPVDDEGNPKRYFTMDKEF